MKTRPIAPILACLLGLALPLAAQDKPSDGMPHIDDGLHFVDGKPFIKTAGWWGINHWMTTDPDSGIGNQLALPEGQVGSDRDFYARAKFSTGYFSIVGDSTMTEKNIVWMKKAIARAKKVGQKLVIHIDCLPPADTVKALGWTLTNEDGEQKPVERTFHHDPVEFGVVMRERLKPYADAIRDEPTVIGYQIAGETWAAVSYDPKSLARYREFLKAQFPLDDLSQRYFGKNGEYASWDEVFPPIKGGTMDFSKKKLVNGRVAQFDWARYNKKLHEDAWVAMIEGFNEADGRGRPFSYEYNHGPYSGSAYGLYNFNFPGICQRTKNLSVGPGEFSYTLAESMHGLYTKTCGEGPWFTNELDGRPAIPRSGYAAYFRRHIWWTLALGGNGYHLWTFFNLLGANNEFIGSRCFDPIRAENLPRDFFEVQHCNQMIASLGTLLAGSRSPDAPIGIFYLDDSSMAGYAGSYKADSYSLMRAMASHGLGDQLGIYTEYHLDTMDLSKLKAIILPRTPRITAAHEKKLAEYVAQGGTLILMAPTGKVDDLCQEAASFPTGPLAKVCGVQAADLPKEALRTAPIAVTWNNQPIAIDVQARLTIPAGSQAQTLVANGKDPIVTMNTYGKGRCYYLAGRPLVASDDDATGDFLATLLKSAGVVPAATLTEKNKVDTGVYVGRRTGPQGNLLILIENADRDHDLTVKLDPVALGLDPSKTYTACECFSDEKNPTSASNGWSFTTRLEAVGVRVFAITAEKDLEAILPMAKRVLIPRDDADAILIPAQRGEGPPAYRSGEALAGELESNKIETLTAAEVHSAPPRDLGDDYLGLDLDGACNRSLGTMLKDADYSGMLQFGALVSKADAKESLPFKPGRNEVGTVPMWVNGRYIDMGKRAIEGIRVGTKIASLHLFHHGIYWLHESMLGFYRVRYADGSTVHIPIAISSTLTDLDRPWGVSPKTDIIWKAKNGNRLSRYDWINPSPDKVVDSVDIIRNDGYDFAVWAMTVKKTGSL